MLRRRNLLKNVEEASILPPGYKQLKYILGNSTGPYIRTGYLPSPKTKLTIKVMCEKDTESTIMITPYFGLWADKKQIRVRRGVNADTRVDVTLEIPKTVIIYDSLIIDGNTILTFSNKDFTDNDLVIFGYHGGPAYIYTSSDGIRLYYMKIEEEDRVIKEYIPCRRESDNEIGLFETVSQEFVSSDSSGKFTY